MGTAPTRTEIRFSSRFGERERSWGVGCLRASLLQDCNSSWYVSERRLQRGLSGYAHKSSRVKEEVVWHVVSSPSS